MREPGAALDPASTIFAVLVRWRGLPFALALLIWADGLLGVSLMALLDIPPLDPLRLRNLLLLLALLAIPFARIGLAPRGPRETATKVGQPPNGIPEQAHWDPGDDSVRRSALLAASGQVFDRVNAGGALFFEC